MRNSFIGVRNISVNLRCAANSFWLCFLVAFLFMMSLGNTSLAYADSEYSISMTSSGAQNIDVVPGNNGGTAISADAITVNTNCRYGYYLKASTSVNNNNLYLDGNSANNGTNKYLKSSNSRLSNSSNMWGYFYDDNGTVPTKNSNFKMMPTVNNAKVTIKTPLDSPTEEDISDSFNIYYGISTDFNLDTGTYKMVPDTNNVDGAVVYYTVTAELCRPYTVHFNSTSTIDGISLSGSGVMNNQTFYEDLRQDIAKSTFVPPTGYAFKEWNTSQDGSGTSYMDGEEVINLASTGETVTLYAIWYEDPCTENPALLYCKVASLVKKKANGASKTQNIDNLSETPTKPNSSNPASDTSNSGVYLYSKAEFGAPSDASNNYHVYYYFGRLDSNQPSPGSVGDGDYYPNYVKLGNDTCWRIIRTTGSGGVKMLFNGIWTNNTCANTDSTIGLVPKFNADSLELNGVTYNGIDEKNMHSTGYTYSNVAAGTVTPTTLGAVLGNRGNDTTTNVNDSIIKQYIEDWYKDNMVVYTSILEPNAGYCADRALFSNSNTRLADDTLVVPYDNFENNKYGTKIRYSGKKPTLNCLRGTVDLYSTATENGGNGQLTYPIALPTMDELYFSGINSGNNTYIYSGIDSAKSYYSMSPSGLSKHYMAASFIFDFINEGNGGLDAYARPVISLGHNTIISSESSGKADDPWILQYDIDRGTPVEFTFDSNIEKITVNGQEVNESGGSAKLLPGISYKVQVFNKDGYIFDKMTVVEGDAEVDDESLVINSSGVVVDLSSVAIGSSTSTVTFTFSNITSITVGDTQISSSGESVALGIGQTYHIVVNTSNTMETPTITSGTGYSISNVNTSNKTFDLTVGSGDGIINIGASCVAAGTLVTMGDGSKKPIEDIKAGDIVMTWSLWNGRYEPMPVTIAFNHGVSKWNILTLKFSDGTRVRTINQHGFFDLDRNTWSYITPKNVNEFIGHRFIKKNDDGSNKEVILVGFANNLEEIGSYSLLTAHNDNFIVEDMLSITGEPEGQEGIREYFTIGEDMKYDEELMQNDIQRYGLYDYEEWSDYMDRATFDAFNGKYFKILIGRGIFTEENIINIIYGYLYNN